LLLGLALLGVSLPTDPAGRAIPLWQDVIAAGVAVAAYSVFFSTPLNMLPWSVGIGMFAHALRWVVITQFAFGVATGALVACVAVASALTPVSRRTHMPFAAAIIILAMSFGLIVPKMAIDYLSAHFARPSD
jgi:hypothetical protein